MEDRRAEQRAQAYWQVVATAAEGISTELNVERVLETVLDQMYQALGAQVAIGVWRLDEAGARLGLMAHRGLGEHTAARLQWLPMDCESCICAAARSRQIQRVADVETAEPLGEIDQLLVEREGLRSWLAAPLLVSGRLLGVLAYGLRVPQPLAEDDLRGISTVAGLFAVAIDHALLYRESQEARQRLEQAAEEHREVNQQLLLAGVREQELAEDAEAARAEAERQAAQMRALLASLTEGVSVFDPRGMSVLVNDVGRDLWQLPPSPDGRYPLDVYRARDMRALDGRPLPLEAWPVSRTMRGESFKDYEIIFVRADGQQKRLSFSGSAIRDARGEVVLGLNVYRDLTELRQLEQLRDEYIGLISHDLRNPLTVAMGQAGWLHRLLLRECLEQSAGSAEAIVKATQRMNSMIQELVDSVRLESGRLQMQRHSIDLPRLVAEVAERTGTLEDRARIRVELPPALPRAFADQERLERALVNLLSNALKYSPPDRPVVASVEQIGDQAVVAVADQGAGIPPENQAHLFERFYRAHTETRVEGLGLGLYITRLIVEAHGGRIWVESEEGKGSTFKFSVPLAADGGRKAR